MPSWRASASKARPMIVSHSRFCHVCIYIYVYICIYIYVLVIPHLRVASMFTMETVYIYIYNYIYIYRSECESADDMAAEQLATAHCTSTQQSWRGSAPATKAADCLWQKCRRAEETTEERAARLQSYHSFLHNSFASHVLCAMRMPSNYIIIQFGHKRSIFKAVIIQEHAKRTQ